MELEVQLDPLYLKLSTDMSQALLVQEEAELV
jgi:hypothetical protein